MIEYDNSGNEWQSYINDQSKHSIANSWLGSNSLDYWRHERLRRPLLSVIAANPKSSWLTIGDGRFGTDANYLMRHGIKSVVASDLNDNLLKIAAKNKFINSYRKVNAESIEFEDDSFDFIYCKEALHHFPRPHIALHEMYRVAKFGVILTEPRDFLIDNNPISHLFNKLVYSILGKKNHFFEPVGNYVYGFSEREYEKFLLGMHFNKIAFSYCNDSYAQDIEFVNATPKSLIDFNTHLKLKGKIAILDLLSRMRLRPPNILTCALIKNMDVTDFEKSFCSNTWNKIFLPTNPFKTTL